jgi:chloramphenicol 3-O-phosphotransferase
MMGPIIIVSGTSGAGKTTTCRELANRAQQALFLFGFDMFVSSLIASKFTTFGARGPEYFYLIDDRDVAAGEARMRFGEQGWRALRAFHDMIAAASRAGQGVVVDHLMFLDPPILQDCIWRLRDVPVLFALLKPPRQVLYERVMNRHISIPQSVAEALGPNAAQRIGEGLKVVTPWLYDGAYANDCCDLLIDSDAFGPQEICEQIESRLGEGPGTAFAALRERYPRS